MNETDPRDDSLSCRVDRLQLRLECLHQRAAGLAETVEASARQFAQLGIPFHAELLADLQQYGGEVHAVRDALDETMRSVSVESPLEENVTSLVGLDECVQALRTSVERGKRTRKRQENAHAALVRLMSLIRKDSAEFPLLERFKECVGTLATQLADTGRASDEESEELLKLATPYEALDRLVRERDVFTLEEEFDLGRTAEAAIEREIVYAVVRGYLIPGAQTVENSVPDAVGVGDLPILSGSGTDAVGSGRADSSVDVDPEKEPETSVEELGKLVDQPDDDRQSAAPHGAAAETLEEEASPGTQTMTGEEDLALAPTPASVDGRPEGYEDTGTRSQAYNKASPPPTPFKEYLINQAPTEPKASPALPIAELRAAANVSARDAAELSGRPTQSVALRPLTT